MRYVSTLNNGIRKSRLSSFTFSSTNSEIDLILRFIQPISRYRLKLGLVQVDPERLRAQEEKEEQRRAEALQKLAERKVCVPSYYDLLLYKNC